MSQLADLTVSELLELYASHSASPVEAAEACLGRIGAVDERINAVLSTNEDEVLAQARESEQRWKKGTNRPLEGVPYGLKDIIATASAVTTGGSALYRHNIPNYDATVAARMSAAGGVRVGKLHTFEFACGGVDNRTFGLCRNPWDTSCTTGGSSTGPAAAVASGEMPVAIGTDATGSTRMPAGYCGITGLKPTYGRVPRYGVMGLTWSLDHVGTMASSVADSALVLSAIAGPDSRDSTSSSRPVPDYCTALATPAEGLIVGRPRGWFEETCQPKILTVFEKALNELANAGVTIVDVELPDIDIWNISAYSILYAEMLSLHQDRMDDIENRDPMGATLLASAPYVHTSDYLRALRYRRLAQGQLQAAMTGIDALVTPGVSTVAPPLHTILDADESAAWIMEATRTTAPFNYTGNPGLCIPIGLAGGLPASMQLIARPHDEATLFTLGNTFQSATTHHTARPSSLTV